jgi:hypothetical protein
MKLSSELVKEIELVKEKISVCTDEDQLEYLKEYLVRLQMKYINLGVDSRRNHRRDPFILVDKTDRKANKHLRGVRRD